MLGKFCCKYLFRQGSLEVRVLYFDINVANSFFVDFTVLGLIFFQIKIINHYGTLDVYWNTVFRLLG